MTRAAESGSLATLIETLRAAGGDAARLGRALRVDLATIQARPKLAFPCAWNRLCGEGSSTLRELLDQWRSEHGDEPWARSLRPPRFAVNGPLIEEYRADFRGPARLSLDQRIIAVRGQQTSISWDRKLGVRVEPAPLPRAASDGWMLDRPAPAWGRCRIIDRDSKAVMLDVSVNDDDSFMCFAAATDGSIVAGGWFEDYAGTVCSFDAKRNKLRWRAELDYNVAAVAISGDARTVVAFTGREAVVLDAASGTVKKRMLVDGGSGALDHEGKELVTQSDRVLRVWDLAAPSEASNWAAVERGWVSAAFSPDGERLLTGQLLCDARTGKVIAQLTTDGPGYLEGGPPMDGRTLTDDRFVEISPMYGIAIVETTTGQQLGRNESRRFSLKHTVRFTRDARMFVYGVRHGPDRAKPLKLVRVEDATEIGELPIGDALAFEIAPAGSQLATAHADGGIRIWELPSFSLLNEWQATTETPIERLIYSLDGARLVARCKDDFYVQWRARDGARLGQRKTPRGTAGDLHGWDGFVGRLHPYTCCWDDGLLRLDHDDPAQVPLLIPTDHQLDIDPSGTRAAFRYEHFALERV